jgi:hypothetical protein
MATSTRDSENCSPTHRLPDGEWPLELAKADARRTLQYPVDSESNTGGAVRFQRPSGVRRRTGMVRMPLVFAAYEV